MSAMPVERLQLADGEVAARAGLAARVRELAEVAILTGADAAESAAVAAEIEALTARLAVGRREAPPYVVSHTGVMEQQSANPVTGTLNPFAPPVDLALAPDGAIRGEFTLSPLYEGPPSYVHGGVSAMVLDQALGMAAAASGTPGMTANLELRYRRPTPLGVPLLVEARFSRTEGRKIWASGSISGPDGRVTVEATAMFVQPQRFATSEH